MILPGVIVGFSDGLGLGAGDSVGSEVGSVGPVGLSVGLFVGFRLWIERAKSPSLSLKTLNPVGLILACPCTPDGAAKSTENMTNKDVL